MTVPGTDGPAGRRSADLSRLHAVVPAHGPGEGKARLGLALDAEEREALVLGLLERTLGVLAGFAACRASYVVSGDGRILRLAAKAGAAAIKETQAGGARDPLNDALRTGRNAALNDGATAVLFLPADLPLVSMAALQRLLDAADAALAAGAGRPVVTAAPADARGGTNALLLTPPDVIEPTFGPASLEAHVRAAADAGATVQLVADAELGFDLDTPDDLERLDPARLLQLVELGARAADELVAAAEVR